MNTPSMTSLMALSLVRFFVAVLLLLLLLLFAQPFFFFAERSLSGNDFVMDAVGHDPSPRLCLKKKLFLTGGLNGDRLEQEVLYYQIGSEIAAKTLPCTEAEAIRLAVVKLQSKVNRNCEKFRLDLRSLLPMSNLQMRSPAEWKTILLKVAFVWILVIRI